MLYPICVRGNFGYIDSLGNIVVPPIFAHCTPFSNGYGLATERTRFIFFDENGSTAFESNLEWIDPVSEGLFTFSSHKLGTGKQGVMNLRGEIVIPERYDTVYSFNHGYAVVRVDGKAGVINRDGEWVLQPGDFDYMFGPDENCLFAVRSNNLWGYVSIHGNVVVPIEFDRTFPGTEALLRVISRDLVGFLNPSGEWAIPATFSSAESFANGYAAVQDISGIFGFINHYGKWIANARYVGVKDFDGGLAPVAPISNARTPKWGFIDHQAQLVIPARFLGADPFCGALALVTLGHEGDTDRYGYLDRNNKLVWQGSRRILIDEDSGERLPL